MHVVVEYFLFGDQDIGFVWSWSNVDVRTGSTVQGKVFISNTRQVTDLWAPMPCSLLTVQSGLSRYLLRFGDMVEQFTELRKSLHLLLKVSQNNGLKKKVSQGERIEQSGFVYPSSAQLSLLHFSFHVICVLVSLHMINFFGLIPDMVNFFSFEYFVFL